MVLKLLVGLTLALHSPTALAKNWFDVDRRGAVDQIRRALQEGGFDNTDFEPNFDCEMPGSLRYCNATVGLVRFTIVESAGSRTGTKERNREDFDAHFAGTRSRVYEVEVSLPARNFESITQYMALCAAITSALRPTNYRSALKLVTKTLEQADKQPDDRPSVAIGKPASLIIYARGFRGSRCIVSAESSDR
ncbi:MAG: hypothetical protein Q7T73_02970 [Beijerinckiaceae bacterium]|nr:hypothetical protein [Beijerinckiaceae bacterium]